MASVIYRKKKNNAKGNGPEDRNRHFTEEWQQHRRLKKMPTPLQIREVHFLKTIIARCVGIIL